MANWYGAARSNYFKVKDVQAFQEAMDAIDIIIMDGEGEQAGLVAVAPDPDTSDDGGWPRCTLDEETGEDLDIDVPSTVALHLTEDSVAVFMQSGHEKLRYVSGYAEAVDHTGERVSVSLSDIYKIAAAQFKSKTITEATY